MANISTENINTLAQVAASIKDGDYIYIYKAASGEFSRIELSLFLQEMSMGGGNIINDLVTGGVDVPLSAEMGKELKNMITPTNVESCDLEFADDVGNVILRLKDGHIMTKNFDSSKLTPPDDDSDEEEVVEPSLKVFFVGNSFSMDAATYVPFIVKAADQNIKLTIGCAYIGGCSLQTHLSNLQNDSSSYTYYKSVNGGSWVMSLSKKMSQMLTDDSWDVVVLQQNSDNAGNYDTIGGTNNYLQGCMNQITTRLGRTPKFWWLLTQKKQSASYDYNTMLSIAKRIMLEYPIDMMIPVGASVELARGTTLDSIGSNGHLEADANGHLQEGLPAMLAGYSLSLTIFRALGLDFSVVGNTYTFSTTPTPATQQNGSVVGMTSANLRIAQRCAVVADKENNYNF